MWDRNTIFWRWKRYARTLLLVPIALFFSLVAIMITSSNFGNMCDLKLMEFQSENIYHWPVLGTVSVGEECALFCGGSNHTVEFRCSKPVNTRWYLTTSKEGSAVDFYRTDILYGSQQDLWIEQNVRSDRIENQLVYRPRTYAAHNDTAHLKTIYLPNGFSAWPHVKPGRDNFLMDQCPVSTCRVTDDSEDASTAHAVLLKPHSATQRAGNLSSQIWIMYALESPFHTPEFLESKSIYNWTATYRLDSEIVAPYEKFVLYNPSIRKISQNISYAATKTGKGKVAWFVSNCYAKNNRLEYAQNLSRYISVDIYGKCGNMQCERSDKTCSDMLKTNYKFYLSFENSNCRWYITEKFWVTGLGSNSIPIVMGAPLKDYEILAPYKSFIHVAQFPAGPQELAQYLLKLDSNDDLYNEYFEWKGTGQLINTFFYCRLCAGGKERSLPFPSFGTGAAGLSVYLWNYYGPNVSFCYQSAVRTRLPENGCSIRIGHPKLIQTWRPGGMGQKSAPVRICMPGETIVPVSNDQDSIQSIHQPQTASMSNGEINGILTSPQQCRFWTKYSPLPCIRSTRLLACDLESYSLINA